MNHELIFIQNILFKTINFFKAISQMLITLCKMAIVAYKVKRNLKLMERE